MSQYYYNPFGNSGANEEYQRAFLRKQQETNEKKEIRLISLTMGVAIIAYLLFQNVAVAVLYAFDLFDKYNNDAVFQSAFTIIGVSFFSVLVPFGIMALVNKKRYSHPIVPGNSIRPFKCLVWVCFGMLCCVGANFAVSYLITFLELLFDIEFTQGELLEPDSPLACVMCVISTAIIPAICEEFAMRCCSLQLLRKYGKSFAVFAVSIVFGLLHGNVIQFIFAFVVGLILGLVTVKTDSIVPAVLIHGLNNGVSALNSILTYTSGEDVAQTAILIVYALWAASGIASLVYLISKGEFKNTVKSQCGVLTNGQKFTAFLFPWMIVPFLILVIITVTTINF